MNGGCGPAQGKTIASIPTNGLCYLGTPTPVLGVSASSWIWSCQGEYGGTSMICSAPKPTTYSWVTSEFNACSKTCGGGTQTRTVTCQKSDGTTVANSFCTGMKPAQTQNCNVNACQVAASCGSANGVSSEFIPSIASRCATGLPTSVMRTTSLWRWTCIGVSGGSSVDCSAPYPPRSTYTWTTGTFAACSKTCGR